MRLHGYCIRCRKVKRVTVHGDRAYGRLQGICDACDDAERRREKVRGRSGDGFDDRIYPFDG